MKSLIKIYFAPSSSIKKAGNNIHASEVAGRLNPEMPKANRFHGIQCVSERLLLTNSFLLYFLWQDKNQTKTTEHLTGLVTLILIGPHFCVATLTQLDHHFSDIPRTIS